MDILDILLSAGFWAATVRIASPLIFATLGELICERAGVLNLGIEGIMTIGAMTGWLWVYQGGSLWGGVAFAASVGMVCGLIHALVVVYLGASQHVTGIAMTLLASSFGYYVYKMLFPSTTTPPKITPFELWAVPVLSDIPIMGGAFFNQTPLTYLAFMMVIIVWWFFYRTPLGLAVRAAGENPAAVEATGLDVLRLRVGAVMAGSALMAVGGAFMTMSAFDAFYFGMINGRGWICIALVIFASWKPGKALLGALLFAGFDALQVRLQQSTGVFIPYQFFLMSPYVLSIIAMVFMARRAHYPKALLVPYYKGQRV